MSKVVSGQQPKDNKVENPRINFTSITKIFFQQA